MEPAPDEKTATRPRTDDLTTAAAPPVRQRQAMPGDATARLRAAAEAVLLQTGAPAAGQRHDAEGTAPLTLHAAQTLVHELQVSQIELEMQNEELREAQAETEIWRDHYLDFYELAPAGYCSLSEAGLILGANLTLASLLRMPRSALLQQPLQRFIATTDRDDFAQLIAPARPAGGAGDPSPAGGLVVQLADATRSLEVRMHRGDGSSFWAQLVARMSPGEPRTGSDRVARPGRLSPPAISVVVTDISQRKQDQLSLQASLAEQRALLKEVHHRVKNNLQVVTSLLRLEFRRSTQPDTRTVLSDMQGRILAMAQLHESLYHAGVFAAVELADYIGGLARQAVRFLSPGAAAVQLRLDLTSLTVPMDQAVPLGLLLNELVSNAFKHGLVDGRSGELGITLAPLPDGARWRLCVSDNGVGLAPDWAARRGPSLGLQLATDLALQAGGRFDIEPGPQAVFGVTFTPVAVAASARRPAASSGPG